MYPDIKITAPFKITKMITVNKYHSISFIHPIHSILSINSKNLNAKPNFLSLFAICAIEIANKGTIMNGYSNDTKTIDDAEYTPLQVSITEILE